MSIEHENIYYNIVKDIRKEKEIAALVSCKDIWGDILIPSEIASYKVTKIEPYAFSEKEIKRLILPKTLEEIGRYAFYRCFKLKKLGFSDRLKDIGPGAFTGCQINELDIHFYEGRQSILKFILDEVSGLLRVTLKFHTEEGKAETARVIFPEHYEEAVENTPARILETRQHGSGNDYRQCFYNRELQFGDYDALLPRAVAEESEEVVTELALMRLRYPYQLSEKSRENYDDYLKSHIKIAGHIFVLREDIETLKFLSMGGYFTREAIDQTIELAATRKKTGVLSVLMDEKHKHFPEKKKVFEL